MLIDLGFYSRPEPKKGDAYKSIEVWLKKKKLSKFLDSFLNSGYDNLQELLFQMGTEERLTQYDLAKFLGINDASEQKAILEKLLEGIEFHKLLV